MRLKSLYIQGFKSFAKPCRLEFDPGISVIVGPNGSGKSNIADAIRWVLGEQSGRALRADSLTDVIFSGSDERRPLGMAEVTLTIDNSDGAMPLDFKEIAITRRTFRSGESGFFINRAPCRLRDIQALFMDTGLSKGALALVGQGEVDAILRARPEERRLFLEETAGVTRYRHQRSEAVRRLEETDAKLVRVADIIKEVEAGMRPLREEAQRAERFEELFARARNLEVGLWHAHRQQRRQAWESLRQEALALRAEAAGLRQELESLERGARELEAALQQARSRVEE